MCDVKNIVILYFTLFLSVVTIVYNSLVEFT